MIIDNLTYLKNETEKAKNALPLMKELKALNLKGMGFRIVTSDLLEQQASQHDKEQGFDLADYFIKRDIKQGWALSKDNYPLFWDK